MSRSRKKTPVATNASCMSQKRGKRLANRRFRRITKALLRIGKEVLPMKNRAITNPYNLGGDGKIYINAPESKVMMK